MQREKRIDIEDALEHSIYDDLDFKDMRPPPWWVGLVLPISAIVGVIGFGLAAYAVFSWLT